jgi:GTP-binding protein
MPAVVKAHGDWATKLKTRDLNDWLQMAIQRHPPPAVNGKRVKPKYMAQIKARPPTFVMFASRADQLPESYRRYLINSLRESFDMPGTPIRITVKPGKNPYADEEKAGAKPQRTAPRRLGTGAAAKARKADAKEKASAKTRPVKGTGKAKAVVRKGPTQGKRAARTRASSSRGSGPPKGRGR